MTGPGWENADSCAQMRARVDQLAKKSWTDAIEVARKIPLPWYRVQSLATVAMVADETRVDAILKEAIESAERDSDPYRRIAVTSWVIDAALARNREAAAKGVLERAMTEIAMITPLKSKATALELLLVRAVAIGEREARDVAAALFASAATLSSDSGKKWRKWGTSFVNRAVRILTKDYSSVAEELLTAHVGPEKAKAILARHSFVAKR